MEPARRAARRLVSTQMIEITQQGRVADASTVRGPIRLRLASFPPLSETSRASRPSRPSPLN